jgi:acylphosphatase
VRVLVSGRVQGVFFRAACAREARRLDLAGSVRNTGGGGVEAVFEGEDAAVDRMVDWCRDGPDLARVDSVEVVEEAPVAEAGFRIVG